MKTQTEVKHTPGPLSDSEREKHLCGPEDDCVSCAEIRRLIAAAPELLKGLKEALESGLHMDVKDIERLAAIVRHAEGRA